MCSFLLCSSHVNQFSKKEVFDIMGGNEVFSEMGD